MTNVRRFARSRSLASTEYWRNIQDTKLPERENGSFPADFSMESFIQGHISIPKNGGNVKLFMLFYAKIAYK